MTLYPSGLLLSTPPLRLSAISRDKAKHRGGDRVVRQPMGERDVALLEADLPVPLAHAVGLYKTLNFDSIR